MKVRLYRGPGDGKKFLVPDNSQYCEIESLAEDPRDTWQRDQALTVNTVRSTYVRTTHTHPDGSVFFEWDRPRGSKSGVRVKPKRKKTPVVNPGYIVTTSGTPFSTITSSGLTFYNATP